MGWDSNPRWAFAHAGFQDRCLKPLGHPSVPLHADAVRDGAAATADPAGAHYAAELYRSALRAALVLRAASGLRAAGRENPPAVAPPTV